VSEYKIVRSRNVYSVVPAASDVAGTQFGKLGDKNDCLKRAEQMATRQARKASGGKKGYHTVERKGDAFEVLKVTP
jgi:hypothetical protein